MSTILSPDNHPTTEQMSIVYDGDCPFCRNYVALMKLRSKIGSVTLVDARKGGPIVQGIMDRHYDLNEGMAVVFGETIYHGTDAVILISSIVGNDLGWIGRLVAAALRKPARAAFIYPIMRFGRNATLRMLGISQI